MKRSCFYIVLFIFIIGFMFCREALAQKKALHLSGIMQGDPPLAVINGDVVKKGDKVGDFEVKEIGNDFVKLGAGGEEVVLRVTGMNDESKQEFEEVEKKRLKQVEEIAERTRDNTDYDEICAYAQNAILSRLKAPGIARFSVCDKRTVRQAGAGEYLVYGIVAAQNSYGAMGQSEWQVLLKKDVSQKYVVKKMGLANSFMR